MYAQVCTKLDIAYAVRILGRYQNNPGFRTLESYKESHVISSED